MRKYLFAVCVAVVLGGTKAEGGETTTLRERLLRATCRVDINPGTAIQSSGTGVFVEVPPRLNSLLKEDEVLVLSAGHVIEKITIRGGVSVTLAKLDPETDQAIGWGETLPARYIDFTSSKEGPDVAMLAAKIPRTWEGSLVHLVPLAEEIDLAVEEEIFAVGCRGGNLPKVDAGKALQYVKPKDPQASPLVYASVLRRSGDSGGGLFSKAGKLIAICSGCIEEDQMEIGAGLRGYRSQPVRLYRGPVSCYAPWFLIQSLPLAVGEQRER